MAFRNYIGLFRNYSGIFRTHCKPGIFRTFSGIFRTLLYSEPVHIKNPVIFRILAYSEPEAYSESYIQNLKYIWNHAKHLRWINLWKKLVAAINFASYNYFYSISFACSLCYKINMNFSIHIKFLLQKYMFQVKKYGD